METVGCKSGFGCCRTMRAGTGACRSCATLWRMRDTFYAWRARRESGAPDWFADRSHAPQRCRSGPIRRWWRRSFRCGGGFASGAAQAARLLERGIRKRLAGGVQHRRHPQAGRTDHAGQAAAATARPAAAFAAVKAVNDEWAVDFKGWFRTGDGARIDPLTMTDSHSRFLIDVKMVPETIAGTLPAFARRFRATSCRWRSAVTMALH